MLQYDRDIYDKWEIWSIDYFFKQGYKLRFGDGYVKLVLIKNPSFTITEKSLYDLLMQLVPNTYLAYNKKIIQKLFKN